MEKRLYCGVALSLKEIALRNVTINLWNASILDPSQKYQNQWYVIEDMVKGKLSELRLLDSLKERIMHLVKPIGEDILHWLLCYEYNDIFFHRIEYDKRIVLQLRRTWAGAIDYRKTAEEFVRLGKFAVRNRFELACLFCLEDKIPILWGELPEESKAYFCERYKDEFRILNDTYMLYYWCSVVREDEGNLERILEKRQLSKSSFYKQALRIAAVKGNKAATEYFFQKLANEGGDFLVKTVDDIIGERFRRSLRTCRDFSNEQLSSVLCHLLSLMTPEQQMLVFKKHPFEVLSCFLDWPFEYLFVGIAELYWRFLSERSYSVMLTSVHKCIKKSGYYCPNVFQEFFLRCPGSFRKVFVSEVCQTGSFLSEFFLAQDTETVQVIFRNIDAGDRVRLVFSEPVFKLLNVFLLRGRWNIVEVCIREATLSKEDRLKLKGEFLAYVTRTDNGLRVKWRTHKRRRFFEFLDGMDANTADKDETPAKVKKSCSDEEINVPPKN